MTTKVVAYKMLVGVRVCVVYVRVLRPVQWTDQQLQLSSLYRNSIAKNYTRGIPIIDATDSAAGERRVNVTQTCSWYRDWYRGKYRRYRYCADTGSIGRYPIPNTGISLSLETENKKLCSATA